MSAHVVMSQEWTMNDQTVTSYLRHSETITSKVNCFEGPDTISLQQQKYFDLRTLESGDVFVYR